MKKTLFRIAALFSISSLLLTGCAEPPEKSKGNEAAPSTSSSTDANKGSGDGKKASDFLACMVSDDGGFDDKSFNETSFNGLKKAEKELGVKTKFIESHAESDFAPNVKSMVDAKCDIVVTVGFLLADATKAAAQQNPNVKFAIVDFDSFEGVNNARGLTFNSAQPSFLAGYLAAAMSKSGVVGTFGGMKIPTVTIFMDGFAQGVKHYNETKGASVRVEGWDQAKQDGRFVPKGFGDTAGGKNTAETMMAQGADVIFPVAGPAGLGALQAAKNSGGKVRAIWVDTDGCKSTEYCDVLMSSVKKDMDVAVFETIKSALDGSFDAKPYVGTLENDGVSLAEFHEFDKEIPAELKKELEQLKKDIIDGKIKITFKDQPGQ